MRQLSRGSEPISLKTAKTSSYRASKEPAIVVAIISQPDIPPILQLEQFGNLYLADVAWSLSVGQ